MGSADQPAGRSAQGAFPVVGTGASAGGLAAFEQFFSALPAPGRIANMAFVLVQHLDPDHESWLSNLVRQYTEMRVSEANDDMPVQPNCAYIIPPNKYLALENGRLRLSDPTPPRGLRIPIDFFFRSLAQDHQGERAICVLVSGKAPDGTLGLKSVKEAGGLVVVQEPDTAQYDGMPRMRWRPGWWTCVPVLPICRQARLVCSASHGGGGIGRAGDDRAPARH